mgnify:CR=1 FL=1
MTILQSLKSLSGYPVPQLSLENAIEEAGLSAGTVIDAQIRSSAAYKRAKAHVYLFLAEAPDVSQGGISYSFSDEDKKLFRTQAEALLDEIGDESIASDNYGWQGEDL